MQDTNADRFASHSGAACGPTDSQGRAALLLRPAVGRGPRAAGIGWIGRILWKRRRWRWCQTGFLFSNPPPSSSLAKDLGRHLLSGTPLMLLLISLEDFRTLMSK